LVAKAFFFRWNMKENRDMLFQEKPHLMQGHSWWKRFRLEASLVVENIEWGGIERWQTR
jgi:hypothetical protein